MLKEIMEQMDTSKKTLKSLESDETYEITLNVQTGDTLRTKPTDDAIKLLEKNNRGKDFSPYLQLNQAAQKDDWETVKKFIDKHPNARTAQINEFGATILHLAVCKHENMRLVEEILDSIPLPSLEEADFSGNTALSYAASVGNVEATTKLVEKNECLLLTKDKNGYTPLHHAASAASVGHKETIQFLLSKTKDHMATLLSGESGATLLHLLITSRLYGVALDILKRHMELDENHLIKVEVLRTLAQKPQEFKSGTPHLHGKVRLLFWHIMRLIVPSCFNDHIHDKWLRLKQTSELVKLICEGMGTLSSEQAHRIFKEPLFTATRLGITELVTAITEVYPDSAGFINDDGQNIFQIAVIYEQDLVFKNLRKGNDYLKYSMISNTDNKDNNILHLAGKLRPSDGTSGAALQMQKELKWFEDVEKMVIEVRPSLLEDQNIDNKTPKEVFTEEHKNLFDQAQQWMKKFVQMGSGIAVIIITTALVTAFTVPTGSFEKGLPNYFSSLHEPEYRLFLIFDGIAVFWSCISVVLFLRILASNSLNLFPRKLFVGLITLYISLGFSMSAFISALQKVQPHSARQIFLSVITPANITVFVLSLWELPLLYKMVRPNVCL